MKTKRILAFIIMLAIVASCKKSETKEGVVYKQLNKQFVFIRDIVQLRASNDPISQHIDSIINGFIVSEQVSTGVQKFDLSGDDALDIGFEIVNLFDYNDSLPQNFDTLAALVIPFSVEILDNSTWGYVDALNEGEIIQTGGNWYQRTSVLGTFLDAGKFNGKGEKYLGIRIPKNGGYHYGWVKIYCSQHNDTLRIISYALNNSTESPILAGQIQ